MARFHALGHLQTANAAQPGAMRVIIMPVKQNASMTRSIPIVKNGGMAPAPAAEVFGLQIIGTPIVRLKGAAAIRILHVYRTPAEMGSICAGIKIVPATPTASAQALRHRHRLTTRVLP